MSFTAERLRKILELEQSKGYADTAVVGGLDRYLLRCLNEGKGDLQLAHLRGLHLLQPGYASLDGEERREWIEAVISQLDKPAKPTGGRGKRASPPRKRLGDKPLPSTSPLDSPITVIKGLSSNLAAKFARLGVETVRDMLYFFPHRHLDYSQRKSVSGLEVGVEQTIIATVWQAQQIKLGNRWGAEAILGDETGTMRVVWFNQPYIAGKLRPNTRVAISGVVSSFKDRPVFESPEWEVVGSRDLTHTGRLVPLYPLTGGLRPRTVRKLMKEVVDEWAPRVPDFLPREVEERCQLMDLPRAIEQAHYPDTQYLKDAARVRLAFDELFLIQMAVLSQKRRWRDGGVGAPMRCDRAGLEHFLSSLPFSLTASQKRVLDEILSDMEGGMPMSRLLQGEVGSGKTVVAAAALLMAVAGGYQGALMAPTEILAEQHFNTISELFSRAGHLEDGQSYLRSYVMLLPKSLTLALLTGSINAGEKQELQRLIAEGEIDIVIGTHALIQKGVEFQRLGLAVVDEQHRFGVMQRSALRQKGGNPHVLVMTATPIPRTLALTLYGDLDISTIDQLPPGRQRIKTRWLKPNQRESAYTFIRNKVTEGQQAFIICPLVEESESIEAKAAIAEYRRLSGEVFPDLRLGLLHGRMSADEKEEMMRSFREGKSDILVSTPVIEVGIDIPNATVMLVESADRFGLSQLHQFRGRVGRGSQQSYCLLVAERPSEGGRERLATIEQTQDGFVLAEEDLRMRGPGEFFGTRQSGLPDLHMARLSDVALLELARGEATRLFQQDPELAAPEHELLLEELARLWENVGERS